MTLLEHIRQIRRHRDDLVLNLTWKLIEDTEMVDWHTDRYGNVVKVMNGYRRRTYKHRLARLYRHEWYLPAPRHANARCSVEFIQED